MTTAVAPEVVEPPFWRPMVDAMSKTAGATIASGLLSTAGTKIIASLLGPGSLAILQTLQQLRDGAVTAATLNGRTALVQSASALEGTARREFLRTVALLFASGMLLVGMAMLAAPEEVLRWSRLPFGSGPFLPYVAVAVVMLSAYQFLTAILNSLRQIGKLALLQLVAPATTALIAWPVALAVRGGHPITIVLLLAIPAVSTTIAATFALRKHRAALREWFQGPGRWWSSVAAREFFAMSGAMLITGLVGTTVLLAVRGSIARGQSLDMTGQFDAAWNISMNHVTLVLGSVQTYYLPSLSATKSDTQRNRQVRSALTIATLAAVPVIVALVTLKPLVVSVLYSQAFSISPSFLRWTLVGDFLKVSSWVLATPMLATRDLGAFLILDLLSHAAFFASAVWFSRFVQPAEGAAIGFLFSYALYFTLCFANARLRYGFRFDLIGLVAWFTGLALVLGATFGTWSDATVHLLKAALWISLAVGFSAGFSIFMRRREV